MEYRLDQTVFSLPQSCNSEDKLQWEKQEIDLNVIGSHLLVIWYLILPFFIDFQIFLQWGILGGILRWSKD